MHATLHERVRYSDILIWGVFLLATSSPPLRDIHPLHGIYYPLSTCALCTPASSPLSTLKTLGDHLPEDSAVAIPRWWLFFHETFFKEALIQLKTLNSPFVRGKTFGRAKSRNRLSSVYMKLIKILHAKMVFLKQLYIYERF